MTRRSAGYRSCMAGRSRYREQQPLDGGGIDIGFGNQIVDVAGLVRAMGSFAARPEARPYRPLPAGRSDHRSLPPRPRRRPARRRVHRALPAARLAPAGESSSVMLAGMKSPCGSSMRVYLKSGSVSRHRIERGANLGHRPIRGFHPESDGDRRGSSLHREPHCEPRRLRSC